MAAAGHEGKQRGFHRYYVRTGGGFKNPPIMLILTIENSDKGRGGWVKKSKNLGDVIYGGIGGHQIESARLAANANTVLPEPNW